MKKQYKSSKIKNHKITKIDRVSRGCKSLISLVVGLFSKLGFSECKSKGSGGMRVIS